MCQKRTLWGVILCTVFNHFNFNNTLIKLVQSSFHPAISFPIHWLLGIQPVPACHSNRNFGPWKVCVHLFCDGCSFSCSSDILNFSFHLPSTMIKLVIGVGAQQHLEGYLLPFSTLQILSAPHASEGRIKPRHILLVPHHAENSIFWSKWSRKSMNAEDKTPTKL